MNLDHVLIWILIGMFILEFIYCTFKAIQYLHATVNQRVTLSKILLSLAPIPIAFRTGDMLANWQNYLSSPMADQDEWYQIFLGGGPGYFYFSIYILLAIFWFNLIHNSKEQNSIFLHKIKWVYITLNAMVYSGWITLLILFSMSSGDEQKNIHSIEAVFSSTVFILAATSFTLYGGQIYYRLKNQPVVSESRLHMSNKVGRLSVICSSMFVVRSILVLLDHFVFTENTNQIRISIILFQTIFELFPTLLISSLLSTRLAKDSSSPPPLPPQSKNPLPSVPGIQDIYYQAEETRSLISSDPSLGASGKNSPRISYSEEDP